jgi:hypothetical protein
MVLTFSQINEAFTNLKPGNETNDNLEQFMAKESMSNFNDSGIESFSNYQNQNHNKKPNYENLAHIVSEEQFVKSKKKAKKRRNNKKKQVFESANVNNYQRLPSQEPSPLLENNMDFSSDEDEMEEVVTNESNETLELKKQMNELDTKLNMLINNLSKQSQDEEKKEEKAKIDVENSNIYDIILFVIFGLFILLLLESLTKLISKNIVKYEPSNSIKAVME